MADDLVPLLLEERHPVVHRHLAAPAAPVGGRLAQPLDAGGPEQRPTGLADDRMPQRGEADRTADAVEPRRAGLRVAPDRLSGPAVVIDASGPGGGQPVGIAAGLQASYNRVKQMVVQSADKMPDAD